MELFFIVVVVFLFLVALIEGACIFALFRQVGLLHLVLSRSHQVHSAGEQAPAVVPFATGMQVPDLAGIPVQGGAVSLSKLAGKRITLAFVHPLCEPCNLIAPELEALHRNVDWDTRVIGISDGDHASTEEYIVEHHLSVPVLYEARSDYALSADVLRKFQVPRTPFAYLLDEQHKVVTSGTIGTMEAFWRVAKGLPDAPPALLAYLQATEITGA